MSSPATPPRPRRADSFLGIHFDFHAGPDGTEIGQGLTPEMIERIIDLVRPDYVQCDCKGHPGFSSYPTRVGHQAPGFVRDPLRIWRDVTAARGVALYMHYSGVWDNQAVKHHPSWARVDEKGKRDKRITSVFGPYVEKLLIPQLKELCDNYRVDGVWVDGDCWAAAPDYGKRVLRAFQQETGIDTVPRSPADPHFFDFLQFCREGFRAYVRRYVDALHAHNPDFQVCSNWAFSGHMPEPVSADVDFLSGDYAHQDSVNSARFEGRVLANQGRPWDLMAWSFSGVWGDNAWCTKTVAQLQREAAVVLALGGGFQAYFQQKRDASIFEWQMDLMAEVAKFCRARQAICHRARAVPQIGLLYSGAAFYRKLPRLFSPHGSETEPLKGILHALLEAQQSVEIVIEHQLAGGRLRDYPLIVVPEWEYLEEDFRAQLLTYVAEGGKLLLIGPGSAALFAKELDVTLHGEPAVKPRWLAHDGWLAGSKDAVQAVTLGAKARAFGSIHFRNDPTSESQPAACVTPYGKGELAAVFTSVGARYKSAKTTVVRDFLHALVRELVPAPLVEVTGSHDVDVTVNRIEGKLAVNLVNTAGPHDNTRVTVHDDIPVLGPLEITIRTGPRPRQVIREPGGEALPHAYADGAVTLTLPELRIHEVVVVA